MTRQDQNVETGSSAIQAGRDVVIQQGISTEQMADIMVAMAKQLSAFHDEALEKANARIDLFQKEILNRFAQPGKANPEAFRDPDFQYLLGDAQEAVARSGDAAVRDTLVDIIARRSLESDRNRLAITLNDAATKAANLTVNEFAALSLAYFIRYTINHSILSFPTFCNYVRNSLLPFAKDVSSEASSFWHLQAQSCGNVEMGEVDISTVFKQHYGGVLGSGFTRQQLEDSLGPENKNALDGLIIACVNDPSKLQPAAINFSVLKTKAANTGLSENQLENVWNLFQNTMTDIPDRIIAAIPEAGVLFEVWKNTPLKNFTLTSVGLAIGHANATRVVGLDAPLNIWIK
jgi:hypothetical protein